MLLSKQFLLRNRTAPPRCWKRNVPYWLSARKKFKRGEDNRPFFFQKIGYCFYCSSENFKGGKSRFGGAPPAPPPPPRSRKPAYRIGFWNGPSQVWTLLSKHKLQRNLVLVNDLFKIKKERCRLYDGLGSCSHSERFGTISEPQQDINSCSYCTGTIFGTE